VLSLPLTSLLAPRFSQAATPIGRVVFDGLRVNSAQTSIVVQVMMTTLHRTPSRTPFGLVPTRPGAVADSLPLSLLTTHTFTSSTPSPSPLPPPSTLQAQPSSVPGATAEIVFPSGQRTAPFIYPMPTWDERVYTWALIKVRARLFMAPV
jgi:hypothetical protein